MAVGRSEHLPTINYLICQLNKRTLANWKFTFGHLQESVKDDSSTETPPTSPPFNTGNSSPPQGPRISPVPAHKGIRKLTTSFRNRSPTGQSPVNKTRKPCQNGKTLRSLKTQRLDDFIFYGRDTGVSENKNVEGKSGKAVKENAGQLAQFTHHPSP